MDFNQLSYNDHTLFHMLRHFEYVNEQARICLNDRGYSMESIDENLAMPGSKFHSSFATDIKSLVAQLKIGKQIQIQERKKYQEIVLSFEKFNLADGIGSVGICFRNELDTLYAKQPVLKFNRGVQLWHSLVSKLPNTYEMTVVLKKQKNSYFLITAFPGLPALPIPHKKMNLVELELSKEFWEDKVFLEKVKSKK